MTDANPEQLIEQLDSPDPNDRAMALAALVQHGPPAGQALVRALTSGHDPVRSLAAQALAEIADPATADTLALQLEDEDPELRAYAALGLSRMGDRRAIDALVQTINDLPDLEHHPYSLSMYGLIDHGPPALPAVAPLLSADDRLTRQRAIEVIRVALTAAGWDWTAITARLSDYDPDAGPARRKAAAKRWAAWLAENC